MADEKVFKLFDFYWFEHDLFAAKQVLSPPKMLQPFEQIHDKVAKLQGRSLSDRYLRYDDTSPDPNNSSPKSVIAPPKLQKILSGEEICEFSNEEVLGKEENKAAVERRRRRKRKGVSRSLSDLEFEELKGFMDLGFVFTEEDKNSSLVSMIPGLQRWGEKGGGEEKSDKYYSVMSQDQNSSIAYGLEVVSSDCDSKISRPYLSEAWEVLDQRMATRQLIKWKFPALHNESNMKNHLKAWAHTVASMIKY